jgi:ELWxxDGT repeat protein
VSARQRRRRLRRRKAAATAARFARRSAGPRRALVTGTVIGATSLGAAGLAVADTTEEFRSSSTAAPTDLVPVRVLRDIDPRTPEQIEVPVDHQLTRFSDTQAVFLAYDGVHGIEPWVTDGTTDGTRLLKDTWPGSASGTTYLTGFVPGADGTVFFDARTSRWNFEPWMSDGTEEGTTLVKEINSGEYGSYGLGYGGVLMGDDVFFAGVTGGRGSGARSDLWRSDGTDAGTFMVTGRSSAPDELTVAGDQLLFSAPSPLGRTLWVTDGTDAGSRPLLDLEPGNDRNFKRAQITAVGAGAFGLMVEAGVQHLWRVQDGQVEVLRELDELAAASRTLLLGDAEHLYMSLDGPRGKASELWRTDGTAEGTTKVFDLPDGTKPTNLATVGDRTYFLAYMDDNPGINSVWVTDGTPAGTTMLVGGLAQLPYAPPSFTEMGDHVWFVANDAADPNDGSELWRTDGTPEGTYRVTDINPGGGSSLPGSLTPLGDQLLFTATDGVGSREVWTTYTPDASTPGPEPGTPPTPTPSATPSATPTQTPDPTQASSPDVDGTVSGLSVTAPPVQRQRGRIRVSLSIAADERVAVAARGRLHVPGVRDSRLTEVRTSLGYRPEVRVVLTLGDRADARVRRALSTWRRLPWSERQDRRPGAVVRVEVVDRAGNSVTRTVRVRIR